MSLPIQKTAFLSHARMASCPLPRYATSCFHNLTWIPKTQWTHYYFQFVYGQYIFSFIRFGIHKFSVVSTQDHFPTEYTIWREIGVLIKPSYSWSIDFPFFSILFQLIDSTIFPDGDKVEFRCDEPTPGRYFSLEGNSTLTCQDGKWSSQIPFCRNTASRTDFSGNSTPFCDVRVLWWVTQ